MKKPIWFAVALIVIGFTLSVAFSMQSGCNRSSPSTDQSSPANNAKFAIKSVDLSALSTTTVTPAYPVDEGRVSVTRPKDWGVLPNSDQHLVAFRKSKNSSFPRIIVRGTDNAEVGQLDETNIEAFHQQVVKQLDNQKVIEPPIALQIGDKYCIRYVVQISVRSKKNANQIERQVLATVQNGREYTINADSFLGKFKDTRDPAYAVLGNMRFAEPQDTQE